MRTGPKQPQRRTIATADLRQEPRWDDVRFVLAQIGSAKYFGLTGDISLGGAQLVLVGASAQVGDAVRAEVGFDKEVIEEVVIVRGLVVYALPRRWGVVVGIRCPGQHQLARMSLARRPARRAEIGPTHVLSPGRN